MQMISLILRVSYKRVCFEFCDKYMLINSYLDFGFLLFSMTTFLQLGVTALKLIGCAVLSK